MDKGPADPPALRIRGTGYPFACAAPAFPVPERNEVHLWTASLRDLEDSYPILSAALSRKERRASMQFRRAADSRNYVIRHGYLRLVLGSCLAAGPAGIPLVTGTHGKPAIDHRPGFPRLSFSLSHTRDLVAVAVAGDHEVGVDIVRPDERYPCREVAEFLFSPAERASLARAAAGPQHLHFFRIWALKEALLKARGGTAMMMKDTDTAAIAGDVTCDSGVPSFCRLGGRNFTLWWHALQNGHYCAIAAGMP